MEEIFNVAGRNDFPLSVTTDFKDRLLVEYDPQWKTGHPRHYINQQLSNDEIKNINNYLKSQRSLIKKVLNIFNL